MKKIWSRREFMRNGALAGAGLALGAGLPSRPAQAAEPPDIASVEGRDRLASTRKAVEALGGMKRFVSKGARVGVLANNAFKNPGAHVHPDVVLAIVAMCLEAGAREVRLLRDGRSSYWDRASKTKETQAVLAAIQPAGDDYVEVKIPGGRALKEASIIKHLQEVDVFINVPIYKDHSGCLMTGVLKNMMGSAPYSTNRKFHHALSLVGWKDDQVHLAQCIADINLVRKPNLLVADGTEFITTNGPYGPGTMKSPWKVAAGTDRVLMDAYGAGLLDLEIKDVLMLAAAEKHGLGSSDLGRAKVLEIKA